MKITHNVLHINPAEIFSKSFFALRYKLRATTIGLKTMINIINLFSMSLYSIKKNVRIDLKNFE